MLTTGGSASVVVERVALLKELSNHGVVPPSGPRPSPRGPDPGRRLRRPGETVRDLALDDEDPVHRHADRDPRKPDHRLPDPLDPDAVRVTGLDARREALVRSSDWLMAAPRGLEDLFALVCRRNPRRVSVEHYRRRLRDKRVVERWPKVTIVDP